MAECTAFMTPHTPYGPGYGQSGYGQSGYNSATGYGTDPNASGYMSGYTAQGNRTPRRPPATPLMHANADWDDSYSINSFGSQKSYEDSPRLKRSGTTTPRTPRTPATPVSARQRALNDAWARARHGAAANSRERGMDEVAEEEEAAPRLHRSRSRSRPRR
jgi:hypothetical protein